MWGSVRRAAVGRRAACGYLRRHLQSPRLGGNAPAASLTSALDSCASGARPGRPISTFHSGATGTASSYRHPCECTLCSRRHPLRTSIASAVPPARSLASPQQRWDMGGGLGAMPSLRLAQSTSQGRRAMSSLISKVMEQVKKDVAANPELKKAMEDLRKSAAKSRAERAKERAGDSAKQAKQTLKGAGEWMHESWKDVRETVGSKYSQLNMYIETSPGLSKAKGAVTYTVGLFGRIVSAASDKVVGVLKASNDSSPYERAKKWRDAIAAKQRKKPSSGGGGGGASSSSPDGTQEQADSETEKTESGLVVYKESVWDRFGSGLKDSPFIRSLYENPLVGNLLSLRESEQAAALRDMKAHDPSFSLPEFVEMVADVVAPHLIQAYLVGEEESLRIHCGEAAFAFVSSSIKIRKTQQLVLDPTILHMNPPQLVAAKRQEEGPPVFVFNLSVQQINCIRGANDQVVEGAVDDIREVTYSIAVTAHPNLLEPGLMYPCQVKEIVVLAAQPTW
eukprot:GHVU01098893.1.p1 GENE.GHVU01098893.1~~GHVU01098893.1.p1  ORF type:complete len:508 (+),score=101.35 GHVU01098893.1:174-1697(+)